MKHDMRKQTINVASTQSLNAAACGSKHYVVVGKGKAYNRKTALDHVTVTARTLCKSPVNALAKRVGTMMISAL